MNDAASTDTIAAPATPPGRGGIGIMRLSGPQALQIATSICGHTLPPRTAVYRRFVDQAGGPVDSGIALYFPAPHSFTGEDVCELQAHGGPVVMELLLGAALASGARLARPGEFSERAYLNGRIDLVQAEAIADLINSASARAARSAMRSLDGVFSALIEALLADLVALRCFVEASIDFPEEEVDFLAESDVLERLEALLARLDLILSTARDGARLREGIHVVLAGRPNAGKSSLMNRLSGRESAIVSAVPGTTRDIVREQVTIDGLPLYLADTAGLRDSPDEIEREGIRRALAEAGRADCLLLIVDSSTDDDPASLIEQHFAPLANEMPPVSVVLNKCDLSGLPAGLQPDTAPPVIAVSARTGAGIDALADHLKQRVGYSGGDSEFSARPRHIDALTRTRLSLLDGRTALCDQAAGELLAEHLRDAQNALGEITGRYGADELLGEIFSSFCIGK